MQTEGCLKGVRVVEFLGLGPGPFAAMTLADMGADVVSIARPGAVPNDPRRFVNRGRTWLELDAKDEGGRNDALSLIAQADILIEGFRPGVMERLRLGPADCHAINPSLIYGRVTGWGQDGPLAHTAGHDINYIAITGALDAIRGGGRPVAPLNLVGDYAGGSLYLVIGILGALHERHNSGRGQVIDAAIVDGTLSLMLPTFSFRARGMWNGAPGQNLLDGGAFFYHVYQCSDGKWLAIGAAEHQFYARFRELGGFTDKRFDRQMDKATWPELHDLLAVEFAKRPSTEWVARFDGSDACVTRILSLEEVEANPHLLARRAFVEHEGYTQPAPAPRFSRTPSAVHPMHILDKETALGTILEAWTESKPNPG